MDFDTIGFVGARHPDAQDALKRLKKRYKHVPPDRADVVVAVGGDGFMLRALHTHMDRGAPVYGLNRGSVGFLMNAYDDDGLIERLKRAEPVDLHPLRMEARDLKGKEHTALAINEVSMLRETRLAAKLKVKLDGVERLPELICDGILVATPAGSTAYNASAHGPIVPIGAGLLALTPISAYRPRRWRGALLPERAVVNVEVIDPGERLVSAVADYTEVRHVTEVTVRQDSEKTTTLLFDPEHDLEERIIKEQFVP